MTFGFGGASFARSWTSGLDLAGGGFASTGSGLATDRVGGPSYNLGLSDERARSIAHYLKDEVTKMIPRDYMV